MIILDATTKAVEVALGSAITTNQLHWTSSYVDITASTFSALASDGVTNNATRVVAVPAPSASVSRQVKFISVYNADTASATVSIYLNNNATTRILFKAVLNVGEELSYLDGIGWKVTDNNGAEKFTNSNGLALTAQATGFTIAGGTTSKTLTVFDNVSLNQSLLTTSSPTFRVLNYEPSTTALPSTANSVVFSTGGGASAPFAEYGNLILASRLDGTGRDILFYTGSTPTARMTINRSGNVGVGISSPGARLVIDASGASDTTTVAIFSSGDANNSYLQIKNSSGNTGYVGVRGVDGFFQAGTAGTFRIEKYGGSTARVIADTAQFTGYGAGTLVTDSSGNVTASSDARLKNVTGNFTRGLDSILALTPKVYTWKKESGMNTDDVNVGFIAQEVQPAIPEAVGSVKTRDAEETDSKTGKKTKVTKREAAEFLSLSDRPIIAALVNAVKELNEKIDKLQKSKSP